MRYFTFINILALLYFGCSGVKQTTEIKPVIIHPPVIIDSLNPFWNDSLFVGIKIVKGDTIQSVKFVPNSALTKKVKELLKENKKLKNLGKFEFKIKPDSIVYIDTVRIVQSAPDYPLTSKLGLILIGMLIGGIITSLIKR